MTNKEAIETLRANYPDACYEQLREAVDKAIKALKVQDASDKKDELKPCPFCGGEAEMNVKHGSYGYTPDIYYVKCKRCGQKIELISEDYKNLSNAVVNTWNSRAKK